MTTQPAIKTVFDWNDLPADMNARARYDLWHDIYTSRYGACVFGIDESKPFHASCEFMAFGQVGITRFDFSLKHYARTKSHVRADHRDDFIIGINRAPELLPVASGPGDFKMQRGAMLFHTNGDPASCHCDERLAMGGIGIPRARILELVPDAEDRVGQLIDASTPAARHLGRMLEMLLDADDYAEDAALSVSIENTLTDLFALALGAHRDAMHLATARGLRAARAREIVAMIGKRFSDPNFSQREVCMRLGLSQRYMQELLQETGRTFSDRVIELRLQKAREMLIDRRNDRLKIGDIAFAAGFGDISYFNQAFRKRFGVPPTAVRGGRET